MLHAVTPPLALSAKTEKTRRQQVSACRPHSLSVITAWHFCGQQACGVQVQERTAGPKQRPPPGLQAACFIKRHAVPFDGPVPTLEAQVRGRAASLCPHSLQRSPSGGHAASQESLQFFSGRRPCTLSLPAVRPPLSPG